VCLFSKCREHFGYTPPLWFVLLAVLSLLTLHGIRWRKHSRMSKCACVVFELAKWGGVMFTWIQVLKQHVHITEAIKGCAHDGFEVHTGSVTACVMMCYMLMTFGVIFVCVLSLLTSCDVMDVFFPMPNPVEINDFGPQGALFRSCGEREPRMCVVVRCVS